MWGKPKVPPTVSVGGGYKVHFRKRRGLWSQIKPVSSRSDRILPIRSFNESCIYGRLHVLDYHSLEGYPLGYIIYTLSLKGDMRSGTDKEELFLTQHCEMRRILNHFH